MSSKLKEYKLSEIVDVTDYVANGSFASLKDNVNYLENGYAILARLVDHNSGWDGNFVYVDEAAYKFLSKSSLVTGDIIISNVGANAGTVFRIPYLNKPVTLGPNAVRVRSKSKILNNDFLYYYLFSRKGQDLLQSIITGSAQPKFNKTSLRGVILSIPAINDQEVIAELMRCIDDRITLLRASNATLEAIAQALFKSWFVDFDPVHAKQQGRAPEGMNAQTAALFPDSFEESELGMVPKGWRVSQLKDCCTKVESGGTPKRTVEEYWNGNIGWLTSGEVRNPIVFDTKEKITQLGVAESSAKVWPTGTTVVAMYGATAGEVCLLDSALSANQACCGLIPKENFRAFLYFCTRRESENLASKSSGSAQQNLNKALVSGHQILMPSESVIQRYEELAGNLLNKWIEGERLADTLGKTRDTLLPRLISGQLRLPEAQALAEEAVDA